MPVYTPLFNIGELIPLKGVQWKVIGCANDKLVLQAVGETQKRKREKRDLAESRSADTRRGNRR